MADLTHELGLRLAIGFLAMPAHGTGARRVARVNRYHSHAAKLRFVGEERPQLSERPIVVLGSLAFANRCPRTNVPQIFYRNRSIRVLSLRDKLFTDAVVYVGLIAVRLAL